MPTIEDKVVTTVQREFVPCLQCGSSEIQFFDLGYSQGNRGGGECKGCGAKHSAGLGWDPTLVSKIAIWNAKNDPKILIDEQNEIIRVARLQIQEIERKSALLKKSGLDPVAS
jgi:hypothetical protein